MSECSKWLTVAEAAAAMGVSIKTVRRWADSGRLPHGRTPTGYRIFDPAVIERMRPKTMDYPRCATCKHYLLYGHDHPMSYGVCQIITNGKEPRATIEIPGFAEGRAPYLEVAEDFGCVLWEAKE